MLSLRTLSALVAGCCVLLASLSAAAVTQPMAGIWRVQNPSLVFFPQYLDDGRPRLVANNVGTVMGTGTNDPAAAGAAIVLPGSVFATGPGATIFRAFPPFPSVAQLTFSYTDTHAGATFLQGAGAAAGITGAGPHIQWCPPINNAATPAPPVGTGGTNCPLFTAVGASTQPVRIQITGGPQRFGGVLDILRHNRGFLWLAGLGTGTVVISKQPQDFTRRWTAGLTNYGYVQAITKPGVLQNGLLTSMGKVASLFGPTLPNTAVTGYGGNWGFKFTTGTVGGSDIFPPVGVCPPATGTVGCFFWTEMGASSITPVSSARNLVLVSGAVATSPASGNLFHRSGILRMVIPEPSTGLGVISGLAALIGLRWSRRQR